MLCRGCGVWLTTLQGEACPAFVLLISLLNANCSCHSAGLSKWCVFNRCFYLLSNLGCAGWSHHL